MIALRRAEFADAEFYVENMRADDVHPRTARQVKSAISVSAQAWCATLDGRPAALFGIARLAPRAGALWLFTTRVCAERPLDFARDAPRVFEALKEGWDSLEGAAPVECKSALMFQRRLGFRHDDELVEVGGRVCRRFWWVRDGT
ncbi:MAG: hypothetical protein AAFR16_00360 [Pseudomonadota bacterium]